MKEVVNAAAMETIFLEWQYILQVSIGLTLKIRVALFVVIVEWQLITTTSSPHCKTEVAFFLAPLPILPLMFCLFACVYAKRTRLITLSH